MVVRPVVTYQAITWLSKATQVMISNIPDKLYRLACVCITCATSTCPTAGLGVILDLSASHSSGGSCPYGIIPTIQGGNCWVTIYFSVYQTTKWLGDTASKKNFLTKVSDKVKRKGELSTYALKANTIKWYLDCSKTD